ncbi:MAG: hypothetical protein ACOC0P_07270 [Planctomycetota bacterium]
MMSLMSWALTGPVHDLATIASVSAAVPPPTATADDGTNFSTVLFSAVALLIVGMLVVAATLAVLALLIDAMKYFMDAVSRFRGGEGATSSGAAEGAPASATSGTTAAGAPAANPATNAAAEGRSFGAAAGAAAKAAPAARSERTGTKVAPRPASPRPPAAARSASPTPRPAAASAPKPAATAGAAPSAAVAVPTPVHTETPPPSMQKIDPRHLAVIAAAAYMAAGGRSTRIRRIIRFNPGIHASHPWVVESRRGVMSGHSPHLM